MKRGLDDLPDFDLSQGGIYECHPVGDWAVARWELFGR